MLMIMAWPFTLVLALFGSFFAYQGFSSTPTSLALSLGGSVIAIVFFLMTATSYVLFFQSSSAHPRLGKMAPITYTAIIVFFGGTSMIPVAQHL